jgi:hypothetical protein
MVECTGEGGGQGQEDGAMKLTQGAHRAGQERRRQRRRAEPPPCSSHLPTKRARNCLGHLLAASPPSEKATAGEDQARQS